MRGIVIPLSANPRDLIRGLRVSEDAVDDLRREIERVEDSTDDVSDEFRDLARNADSSFDKARRSADRLEDEIGDVEAEAGQSAKEFGAAFRGDPVEALEEVQSYLAEIVSVKLPGFAGALATIAGGAAIGAILSFYEKWRERQEEINEKATDYLGIINTANQSITKTNELLVAQAVLEEASAAQVADLALLASARGETVEQYVTKILSGEISTQNELKAVEAERQAIADRILELGGGRVKANQAEIDILKQQDSILQAQGEALRAQGTELNDNVAALEKARTASLQLEASYARAKREATEIGRSLDYATRNRTVQVTVLQNRRLPQP